MNPTGTLTVADTSINGWPTVNLHTGESVTWPGHCSSTGCTDTIRVSWGPWYISYSVCYNLLQTLLPGAQRGGARDNPSTAFHEPSRTACQAQGLPQYSVNTSYLNLVVEDTDLAYQSFGHAVAMRRVWSMTPSVSGLFGKGWAFQYESVLQAYSYASGGATVRLGSGQVLAYHVTGSQGQGTGTVAVAYACNSQGVQPTLSGVVSEATQAGYYLLVDQQARLTYRYDYVNDDAATGMHNYRLSSIEDRNANTLTMGYGPSGKLNAVTDASGRVTAFTTDANGRCTRFDTFDNKSASFSYDASGYLTQTTDLAGNVSSYVYDANGLITSMTAAGKTTQFAYAQNSNGARYVASVTDAGGGVWGYGFVSGGVGVTEPGGAVTTYANSSGQTTYVTDALNLTSSAVYNFLRLPVSLTDPRGKTTTLDYDASGNLLSTTDPLGHTATFSYDAQRNLTGITDPLGNAWSCAYDAKGNLLTVTSPMGKVTSMSYDSKGRLLQEQLPGGGVNTYTYDAHGNLTGFTDPVGNHATLAYDAAGLELTSSTDARGNTTSFQYDANRRRTRATLPGGAVNRYAYDCCALSSETSPLGGVTLIQHDARLHVTRVTDPLGRFTSYAYNASGDRVSSTDPLGLITSYGLDAAHRTVSMTNALGKSVGFSLDASGNPTGLTDERGKTTTMSYDNGGWLASVTDPLGRRTSLIARDAAGRVNSVTNARGQSVSFVRDAEGRATAKQHNGAGVASFTWDGAGRLATATDTSGTKSYSYDAAGRVVGVAYPDGLTLAVSYDAAGNIGAMTYPGGQTVSYAYDGRNRPTSVNFSGTSVGLSYDASGNLTGESRSNGVQSVYGYDGAERLTGVSHKKGATVVADLVYIRDAAGRVVGETGTWPLLPRLAGAVSNAVYNNANGLTTWKGDAYAYDTDGNLTTVSGSRAMSVAYDPENRPVSVSLNGISTTYAYDGLGDRVRSQTGAAIRNFHHDPWGRLLCETNSAGLVTVNYLYAGGRLVASGTAAAGYVFHHQDKTGNTLALTDASGNTVASYAYSPYGAVANRSGVTGTSFTYAGAYGVMDEGNGLYYMKNRFYDANTGRFLTRDPIGFDGGANLYRYVGGNPISGIDPLGLADLAEGTYDICTNRLPTHLKSSMASDAEMKVLRDSGVYYVVGVAGLAGLTIGIVTGPELITFWTASRIALQGAGVGYATYKLLEGKDTLNSGKDLVINVLPAGPLFGNVKALNTAFNSARFTYTNRQAIERELTRKQTEEPLLKPKFLLPPIGVHY